MPPCAPDFDWIAGGLAIGACFAPGSAAMLASEHGVGAVIDVRLEACDDPAELAACGLRFLHLPTADHCGVSLPMLDAGVAFARDAAQDARSLLVHCREGIGRSAVVALCILVDRGLPPLEALSQAKAARAKVSPSRAQYESWANWLRRRAPRATIPTYHEFGCVAYRHLAEAD